MRFKPSYIKLYKSGVLDERIRELYGILESCELCPRKCGKNRLRRERGFCKSGRELMVSSYAPHFGEEKPLVGTGGSGTIFLTNCNLRCVYCQNYEISHLGIGREVSTEGAAEMMIKLQMRGCHNVNLVTPTHFTPQIARSIKDAIKKGLCLPIVYNCGGYENVETIKLLEDIVDIYMPDIKYSSKEPAKKYSDASDYFDRCRESIREMHRQVGDLKIDEDGIAHRGLLVRHLILPNDLAGSKEVLKFVSGLSKDSYVNIMDQYRPKGEAWDYEELSRRPTREEFYDAMDMAKRYGLHRFSKEYFRIY
jgi:putative pyruvate formate lyase activating enzyme